MKDYLEVIQTIRKLKEVKRAGWILRKVPNVESVADHSFQTAIIAFLLADKMRLDKTKCVEMALVHDVSEVIAGDKTPLDNLSKEEKHELEKSALLEILKPIPDKNILALWEEYEEQKTPESLFVKELDKMEMLIQAYEYHTKYPECDLKEFWTHVDSNIKNPKLKEMIKQLPY